MLIDRHLSSTSAGFYPSKMFAKTLRKGTEVPIETFIREQLRLKAHTVTGVEETDECMIVRIDRLGKRLLRCGACRQRRRQVLISGSTNLKSVQDPPQVRFQAIPHGEPTGGSAACRDDCTQPQEPGTAQSTQPPIHRE